MFPFIGLIISAGLFYLIVVSVTSDRDLSIWQIVFWFIGSTAAILIGVLIGTGLGLPEAGASILGILASLGVLVLILWHQGYAWKQVWTIILLYGLSRFGLHFLMMLARHV
jgi:hypothetical protein